MKDDLAREAIKDLARKVGGEVKFYKHIRDFCVYRIKHPPHELKDEIRELYKRLLSLEKHLNLEWRTHDYDLPKHVKKAKAKS